jgi:hypothetical protein
MEHAYRIPVDRTTNTEHVKHHRRKRLWENYKLCSNNCQNYAKGLGQYLIGDCTMPTRKRNAARSDEERDRQMAEYIFKLAGDGTCSNFTLPLPNSAGVRLAPTLFTILSTFMVVGWCF